MDSDPGCVHCVVGPRAQQRLGFGDGRQKPRQRQTEGGRGLRRACRHRCGTRPSLDEPRGSERRGIQKQWTSRRSATSIPSALPHSQTGCIVSGGRRIAWIRR
eukprot:7158234-Pyramimonas_sp.AAC.1